MKNEFEQIMSTKTNEELIRIIGIESENYQPLAVEAAQNEVKKRNIPESEIEYTSQNLSKEKEISIDNDKDRVSSGIRLLNFMIDFFVWLVIVFILSFITYVLTSQFVPISQLNENQLRDKIISYLIIFASFILYYAILEFKFQKTIGKMITKTRVVKHDGEKPNATDIIIRTFMRLVPFDHFSFLFTRNGFHDMLSKTKVVKD